VRLLALATRSDTVLLRGHRGTEAQKNRDQKEPAIEHGTKKCIPAPQGAGYPGRLYRLHGELLQFPYEFGWHTARLGARATMLSLDETQRAILIEKVPDIANVAAGATVFGQAVSDRPFSFWLASTGLVVWTVLMTLTLLLARKEES
jgi:hypothetical protein